MAETTLQIYDPAEIAEEAEEALPAGAKQHAVYAVHSEPVWKRIVWWLSCALMLYVGLGVLQMLALLVQAERVRGALEESLATAQLPKATSNEVLYRARQLLFDMNLSTFDLHFTGGNPVTSIGFTSNPDGMSKTPHWSNKYIEGLQVNIPTTDMLPRWLGPRLPFVCTEEVHVQCEANVGREE